MFGYGRWSKIREASLQNCGSLEEKSETELNSYSISFLKALFSQLSCDAKELKQFLESIIETENDDYMVESNACKIRKLILQKCGEEKSWPLELINMQKEFGYYIQQQDL